jgi:hypothetical protein
MKFCDGGPIKNNRKKLEGRGGGEALTPTKQTKKKTKKNFWQDGHLVVCADHHGRDVVVPAAVRAGGRGGEVERGLARAVAEAVAGQLAGRVKVHLKFC